MGQVWDTREWWGGTTENCRARAFPRGQPLSAAPVCCHEVMLSQAARVSSLSGWEVGSRIWNLIIKASTMCVIYTCEIWLQDSNCSIRFMQRSTYGPHCGRSLITPPCAFPSLEEEHMSHPLLCAESLQRKQWTALPPANCHGQPCVSLWPNKCEQGWPHRVPPPTFPLPLP